MTEKMYEEIVLILSTAPLEIVRIIYLFVIKLAK